MGRNGFLNEVTNFSLENDHGDIAVLVVMSHGEAGGLFSIEGHKEE